MKRPGTGRSGETKRSGSVPGATPFYPRPRRRVLGEPCQRAAAVGREGRRGGFRTQRKSRAADSFIFLKPWCHRLPSVHHHRRDGPGGRAARLAGGEASIRGATAGCYWRLDGDRKVRARPILRGARRTGGDPLVDSGQRGRYPGDCEYFDGAGSRKAWTRRAG